ncbi:hypothetical protein FHS10_000977 [Mucilaginibacter dorajii]|nr:hypothetical protein [Mucilaginibacter dorajii]
MERNDVWVSADDSPRRGYARLPLSPTASHRGAKKIFASANPLCGAAGERVIQRSVDRVSRSPRSCNCLWQHNTSRAHIRAVYVFNGGCKNIFERNLNRLLLPAIIFYHFNLVTIVIL